MIQLRRIDHACLRVADLDDAVARWTVQFGLTERGRDGGRALLACGYEPYSLELVEGQPGYDHQAFELARGCTLGDAAADLDRAGVDYEERDGALHLADADGFGVELVPFRPADDPRPDVARSTTELHGYRPRKLGHTNFLTGDLDAQVGFYTDVLGMRLTDRLGDEGAWLHCNADHHVLALVDKGTAHIHHIALELVDWGELRVALDHLAQHGRWLAWGPLRHGLGRNLSAYVRIPEEELFVELFCDMEQLEPDHEPRDWPDDAHSSNVWGILPPRSYFRFDPAAVEAERRGLEALGHGLPPLEPTPEGAR
ncbi:MAG TPA: VOC family protein [Gaiellaceae bacterium]|nr:VOC family protein [Gaiellaceae bacterium]